MRISYLADQLTRKIATLKLQISVLQDEIIDAICKPKITATGHWAQQRAEPD